MFKYEISVKKGKGMINESNFFKKKVVIKSKKRLTESEIFSKVAQYFKKKYNFIVESIEANEDDEISVYVGTWKKYTHRNLGGKWVDLSDFETPEEFKKYCHEKLHADEKGEAELMFQDVKGPAWIRDVINQYGMNYDFVWGYLALDDYEKEIINGYAEIHGVDGWSNFDDFASSATDNYRGGEGQNFDDWCKDYFEEMFGFMSVNPSRGRYGRSEEGFISKYPYYIDVENAKLYMDNDGWGYNEETDEYDEISDEDAMDWIRDGGGDRRIETEQDLIDNSLIDWELIERDWRIEYSVASNGCVFS